MLAFAALALVLLLLQSDNSHNANHYAINNLQNAALQWCNPYLAFQSCAQDCAAKQAVPLVF